MAASTNEGPDRDDSIHLYRLSVDLTVRDDGPDISEGLQPRLFTASPAGTPPDRVPMAAADSFSPSRTAPSSHTAAV